MNDTDEGKDEGRESKDKEKSGEMKGSKEAGVCARLRVFMNTSQSRTLKKKNSQEKLILSLSSKLQVLLQTITEVLYLSWTRVEKKFLNNLLLIKETLTNTKCHM